MKQILIIEDSQVLRSELQEFLIDEGHKVETAGNLNEAREKFRQEPSLIILDWNLPDGNGIDFLREIRSDGSSIPVVFLSGKSDTVNKVLGLEAGANDYLTKPCVPQEIAARIRVQFRQNESVRGEVSKVTDEEEALEISGVYLNPVTREVRFDGRIIPFRKMEFDLLKMLMANPNRVFSRDEILNRVWGFDAFPTTRTIDTHMLSLRNKLKHSLFETVRGIGYRMVDSQNEEAA